MYRISRALLFTFVLTGCSIVAELTEQNKPIIEAFTPTPEEGLAPLNVLFRWGVSDLDDDTVTCRLDYGDGESTRISSCSEVSDDFHVYQEPGSYIAKLTANDGGNEVSRTAAIRVNEDETPDPEDEDFAVTSFIAQPNQGEAPLLSVLNWTLQADGPATCTLSFGDGSDDEVVENCHEVTNTLHTFEEAGGYSVILEATNGNISVRKSLVVLVDPQD